MPAIQPENNTADEDTEFGLPYHWLEIGATLDEMLNEVPAVMRRRIVNSEEDAPSTTFAHGVTTCVVCGHDSWAEADGEVFGRIVIANQLIHSVGTWRQNVSYLAPVHLQCVNYCDGHGEYLANNLFHNEGDPFCTGCYENRSTCDYRRCDVEDWTDNLCWDETDEAHYCDHHYLVVLEERGEDDDGDEEYDYDGRGGVIQSYSYRPTPIFRLVSDDDSVVTLRRPGGSPFLGFELETNCREDDYTISRRHRIDGAKFLLEQHPSDYLYVKEDGSITGFEIVSHPATVYAHKRLLKPDALRALATTYGQASWTSVNGTGAGLHVHISKSSFVKPSHIQRFQMFHSTNAPMIKKLAGRDSNRWATFERGNRYGERMIDLSRGHVQSNRYSALNFQNSSTIELRYFRGSLDPRTVFGVLEFVHSLWKYTQVINAKEISDGNIAWERYRNWLLDENDSLGFDHLLPLLEKRGV